MSSSIFKDHNRSLNEEHLEFETYQEKTKISDNKCQHKNLDFVGMELRCRCGNTWSGTARELKEIYDLLMSR